jgi:hypothetical protein
MKHTIRRPGRLVLVVVALFALAGGIAYATVPDDAGVFNGCMLDATGTIRMVDPSAPKSSLLSHPCTTGLETPISFNERGQQGAVGPQGPAGPQGPQGEAVHGYRANRGVEIRVTGVGQGQFGFPSNTSDPAQETDIVSLPLPQGVYYVHWSANVLKESGGAIFSCVVGDKSIDFFTGIARTALGADGGFTRWASISAPGFYNIPAGGGRLTLECFQSADNAVAGTPSGENPDVIQANINALKIGGATITNAVTGVTSEIP